MSGREIKKIVEKVSFQLGIKRQIYVRVVSFKNKLASVSFTSGILRINRDFVHLSNLSLLKYIIIHELVHIKLGHHYHNDEFYQEIKKYLNKNVSGYDKKVYNLIIKLNKLNTG